MQHIEEKDGGDGKIRPPVALLHAESQRRDAWRFGSLRIRSSGRGRRASLRSFEEQTAGGPPRTVRTRATQATARTQEERRLTPTGLPTLTAPSFPEAVE